MFARRRQSHIIAWLEQVTGLPAASSISCSTSHSRQVSRPRNYRGHHQTAIAEPEKRAAHHDAAGLIPAQIDKVRTMGWRWHGNHINGDTN